MKTGFTCPAGFNVVGSATRDGKRLIVVVLGSPTPVLRTMEAARLLDQGFAKWGGGLGPVENLPASPVTTPPDMRGEICSRRNRAAAIADEEEIERRRAPPPPKRGVFAGRSERARADELRRRESRPVHFEPVPVFVGPIPGWTGPVLAAKPTDKDETAAPPAAARAYANDKPSLIDGADAQSAPAALQGAVKPPIPSKRRASRWRATGGWQRSSSRKSCRLRPLH